MNALKFEDLSLSLLKKHERHAHSHICSNCGVTSSPAWRKGFKGEVLCNACGIQLRRFGRVRTVYTTETSTAEKKGNNNNSRTGAKSQKMRDAFAATKTTGIAIRNPVHPLSPPSALFSEMQDNGSLPRIPTEATLERSPIDTTTNTANSNKQMEQGETHAEALQGQMHNGSSMTLSPSALEAVVVDSNDKLYVTRQELMAILCFLVGQSITRILKTSINNR